MSEIPASSSQNASESAANPNPTQADAENRSNASESAANPTHVPAGAGIIPSIDPKSAPPTHATTAPALSLQAADIYQQQTLVLSQVNFSVQAGEFVYLIGKT
ncbi:MAG: hypothetical protein ACKO6M_06800, partial [Bacteroidota bacterium]